MLVYNSTIKYDDISIHTNVYICDIYLSISELLFLLNRKHMTTIGNFKTQVLLTKEDGLLSGVASWKRTYVCCKSRSGSLWKTSSVSTSYCNI